MLDLDQVLTEIAQAFGVPVGVLTGAESEISATEARAFFDEVARIQQRAFRRAEYRNRNARTAMRRKVWPRASKGWRRHLRRQKASAR